MLVIIGVVVVIGCILGGYLLEHGLLMVLFQPAELLIIGGAALGALLIGNPMSVIKHVIHGLLGTIKGSPYTKAYYLKTMKMLYDFFSHTRKNGIAAAEADLDDPKKSAILSKYPEFLNDTYANRFFCDSLRTAASGGMGNFELDQVMEGDIEVFHHEAREAVTALNSAADSLPGLGIVAAVLGIVITMGAMGGPPEEIGKKVAAALVGTFLGILLCYGFVGPLAQNISTAGEAQIAYYQTLRIAIIVFLKGAPPLIAVEALRRAIPMSERPTFAEMETTCRNKGGPAAAAPAAAEPGKEAAA